MASAILPENPVGVKYGRLTVKEAYRNAGHERNKQWRCECECGKEITASKYDVARGFVKSCGCLRDEKLAQRRRTHGMRRTKEYSIWSAMRTRCYNPKATHYDDYGGRGISVCDRWRHSFEAFFEDMGECPSEKHSIDRINNDGNYEPSNCRWATQSEQCLNRRPKKRTPNAERTAET